MYKISFVCHGNICRSPLADFLFKDMLEKLGRNEEFSVVSRAVSDEEIWGGVGNPVYPPVQKLLAAKGISCANKRAALLTKEEGDAYDWLLCMDDSNVRRAKTILGAKNGEKCVKLLSFTGENGNVADPWYTRNFQSAYDDIERGLLAFLRYLDENDKR